MGQYSIQNTGQYSMQFNSIRDESYANARLIVFNDLFIDSPNWFCER